MRKPGSLFSQIVVYYSTRNSCQAYARLRRCNVVYLQHGGVNCYRRSDASCYPMRSEWPKRLQAAAAACRLCSVTPACCRAPEQTWASATIVRRLRRKVSSTTCIRDFGAFHRDRLVPAESDGRNERVALSRLSSANDARHDAGPIGSWYRRLRVQRVHWETGAYIRCIGRRHPVS